SHRPSPVPPLWKPEPEWILKHEASLALTSDQKLKVTALDAEWRTNKQALLEDAVQSSAAVSKLLGETKDHRGASVGLIQRGLGEYTEDSRQLNALRADFWLRAIHTLNENQQKKLASLTPPEAKR